MKSLEKKTNNRSLRLMIKRVHKLAILMLFLLFKYLFTFSVQVTMKPVSSKT